MVRSCALTKNESVWQLQCATSRKRLEYFIVVEYRASRSPPLIRQFSRLNKTSQRRKKVRITLRLNCFRWRMPWNRKTASQLLRTIKLQRYQGNWMTVEQIFWSLSFVYEIHCWIQSAAPIVRSLDNAIHRINHYPADSVVCFVNAITLIRWIAIYPVDSVTQPLNNWGQNYKLISPQICISRNCFLAHFVHSANIAYFE